MKSYFLYVFQTRVPSIDHKGGTYESKEEAPQPIDSTESDGLSPNGSTSTHQVHARLRGANSMYKRIGSGLKTPLPTGLIQCCLGVSREGAFLLWVLCGLMCSR